mmetsp:Transcript_17528/g.29561  ORF Transcript_17528/g.29561 Transcript_17528/m.29561 type:complete len:135 (+) Transcript_17528:1-405(+)
MDYYSELGLDPKKATHEEVATNFRRLAIEYHPFKNTQKLAQCHQKFSRICQAYDVLSNPLYKAVYDKYGIEGLKNGVKEVDVEEPIVHSSYLFDGNSFAVFQRVFGKKNPFAENFVHPDQVSLVKPEQVAACKI